MIEKYDFQDCHDTNKVTVPELLIAIGIIALLVILISARIVSGANEKAEPGWYEYQSRTFCAPGGES